MLLKLQLQLLFCLLLTLQSCFIRLGEAHVGTLSVDTHLLQLVGAAEFRFVKAHAALSAVVSQACLALSAFELSDIFQGAALLTLPDSIRDLQEWGEMTF